VRNAATCERDGRLVTAQQRGIGAAVTEHRLGGVSGDDGQLRAGRQHAYQPRGVRIEVLRVVDEK
jgi:hypothetical protein